MLPIVLIVIIIILYVCVPLSVCLTLDAHGDQRRALNPSTGVRAELEPVVSYVGAGN